MRLLLNFQRRHVDHKEVFHVAFEHAFIGCIDILDIDHFNIGRDAMLAADATTAAFQVGYESPSQFSREYSRMFGAPPLRDITNLRQMATPGT